MYSTVNDVDTKVALIMPHPAADDRTPRQDILKERNMKTWLIAALMAGFTAALFPSESEAKRFGGGRSSGMQRSTPTQTAPDAPPAKPAAPAQATTPAAVAAPAAAAAPRRSWMGPVAGLAAGLGIAALMSHLGLSEALGNFLTLALLAVLAVVVIRFLMRRFAGNGAAAQPFGKPGMQFAGAGAGNAGNTAWPGTTLPQARSVEGSGASFAATPGSTPRIPADFDTAGFERIAKMIFIRLQAANDAGDLNDLRAFTTPEMYSVIKLDLQERGTATQQTDVVKVEAQVLDVAEEADRQVVSVRFSGLIREELNGTAADFDEVWHLVKPSDDSRSWMIAGIQQNLSSPAESSSALQ
jgi:predicted lipid-binding transport protein (Tim44 family)